ncbi:MAG: hypothetical protein J3Q66DRAFT_321475 [Benniella sp.]|nr:MAG: hypothetical protein J3Q66DRAFT_321475 [Benniella sp.]
MSPTVPSLPSPSFSFFLLLLPPFTFTFTFAPILLFTSFQLSVVSLLHHSCITTATSPLPHRHTLATNLQTMRRSDRLAAKVTAAATDPTPVVKEEASETKGAPNKNQTKTPPKAKNKAAVTKKTGAKKAGVKIITTTITTGGKTATATATKTKTTVKTAAKSTATASSKKRKAEAEDDNEKANLGGDGATPKKRSRTTKKPDVTAKAEDHDMKQADSVTETDPSTQEKKTKATRKKRSAQQATEDDMDEGSGQGDPKPKRAQTKSTKAKGKMVDNAVAVYQPPVINPSDPCQVLPTELWHQILSLLPLSKVAGLSMVSKTWLDGTRTYPAWKSICEALKLGEPKIKFRSYMAMVCARSFFICDKCHSSSTGRGNASEIPLPVADKDDDDFVWMLCHACRLEYYGRYPENVREAQVDHDWQMKRITKTNAQGIYHLSDEDMYGLYYQERRNPHYRNAYPMKLYDRYEVQERALQVHAGWVGVDAFTNGIAKKRSAAFKARWEGLKTKVHKKPQKEKDVQQQLVEGQEQPSSQSNADGQTQVQASSEDQQRQGGICGSTKDQTLPQTQVLLLPVVETARMVADDFGKQCHSQALLQEPVKVVA